MKNRSAGKCENAEIFVRVEEEFEMLFTLVHCSWHLYFVGSSELSWKMIVFIKLKEQ